MQSNKHCSILSILFICFFFSTVEKDSFFPPRHEKEEQKKKKEMIVFPVSLLSTPYKPFSFSMRGKLLFNKFRISCYCHRKMQFKVVINSTNLFSSLRRYPSFSEFCFLTCPFELYFLWLEKKRWAHTTLCSSSFCLCSHFFVSSLAWSLHLLETLLYTNINVRQG